MTVEFRSRFGIVTYYTYIDSSITDLFSFLVCINLLEQANVPSPLSSLKLVLLIGARFPLRGALPVEPKG